MTTRPGSAPASSSTASWANPTSDMTPWVMTAIPVARDARATARKTRSSCAESQGLSVPISPMIPGRTPVPSAPSSNSRTISSASEPTERRSMSASAG